jgi:hypothetical protein
MPMSAEIKKMLADMKKKKSGKKSAAKKSCPKGMVKKTSMKMKLM